MPELRPALSFEQAITTADGARIVAYEGDRHHDLRGALRERPGSLSLFVGPEGGYDVTEASFARDAGAQLITLGPRVLRTETASPLLAALVLYELGDLSSWGADNASD